MNKHNKNMQMVNSLKVPSIFIKKINDKHKVIPFNFTHNTLGPTKHFPPATQEWSNSVYSYNHNSMKNLSVANKNLTRLIKSYFNLHLNRNSLKSWKNQFSSKRIAIRFKRLSPNKIFVSKAELKHTNSKVVITIYVYNEERRRLISNLNIVRNNLYFIKYINKHKDVNSTANNIKHLNLNPHRLEEFEFTKLKHPLDLSRPLEDFFLSYDPPLSFQDKLKYIHEDFLIRLNYMLNVQNNIKINNNMNKMQFFNAFITNIPLMQLLDIYKTILMGNLSIEEEILMKNKKKDFIGKRLTLKELNILKVSIKKLETKKEKLNTFITLLEDNKILYEKINREVYPKFVLEKVFLTEEYKEIFKNKYLLTLNQNKFKDVYLLKLKTLIENIYNKEVEFNFVNLKNVYLNSNMFVQAIGTKLKNRNNKLLRVLKSSIRTVKLPKVNRIRENYQEINIHELRANKVKNLNISTFAAKFANKDLLEQLILNILPNRHKTSNSKQKITEEETTNIIQNSVLTSLKYKTMAGARLEARGRLTKRFTASRSVFKLKWKGGLKNIDSSFRGLSSVMLRGHVKPNVQYTLMNSKTRIGAFGLKGWIGGK